MAHEFVRAFPIIMITILFICACIVAGIAVKKERAQEKRHRRKMYRPLKHTSFRKCASKNNWTDSPLTFYVSASAPMISQTRWWFVGSVQFALCSELTSWLMHPSDARNPACQKSYMLLNPSHCARINYTEFIATIECLSAFMTIRRLRMKYMIHNAHSCFMYETSHQFWVCIWRDMQ
jgi:hypothetical protein